MNKHNLTSENYFSSESEKEYFGSSSIKAYDNGHTGIEVFGNLVEGGCEAREIAVVTGEYTKPDKKVFLVGQYVHNCMDSKESFQKFCSDNYPKIYTGKGKPRADFERADLMIEVLKNCPIVTDMKDCEHEVIFVGEIAGVKIKIMVDLLDLERGYFADYKTTDKIGKLTYKNGKKLSFIDTYDYKLQFAIYEEIIYQNTGKHLQCYIIVVDKKPTPEHNIIYMGSVDDSDWYAEKLEEVELKLPRLQLIKTGKKEPVRCEECAFCVSTRILEGPISLEKFEERLRE